MLSRERTRADGNANDAGLEEKAHAAVDCDETALYTGRPAFARGKGLYIWVDKEEIPYLDLVQGYSVTIFGHCDEELTGTATSIMQTSDHVSGMTSAGREELANLLASLTPVDQARVYFDVGGAQIVSTALRIARKVTNRHSILAIENGFHGYFAEGEHIGNAFIGGGPATTAAYMDVQIVRPGSDEVVALLNTHAFAALLLEPIQGANGLRELPAEWIHAVAAACRETGTLLIADEVQVGLGRTGHFAAISRYGVRPDILLYGKALCAGLFPLSAMLVSGAVYRCIPPFPASAMGSTFSTSPYACALGVHVVSRVQSLLSSGRIEQTGALFDEHLQQVHQLEGIASVRRFGLALGIECISGSVARSFVETAWREHLHVYACGTDHSVIKIYPPFTISANEARLIGEKLVRIGNTVDAQILKS